MFEAIAIMALQAGLAALDYPPSALREGREGVTEYGVITNPQGRVVKCWIIQTSGSPDLDAATCRRATRHMQVTPPLDAEGHPSSASWRSKMEWKIDGSQSKQAHPDGSTEGTTDGGQ
jgi:TonB family protein